MRITTKMLDETAKKSGLPINNISLLNYIEKEGTKNTLLDALNKNNVSSVKKDDYEKMNKKADELMQATDKLLQDGENSLFEQAKTNGDYQKIYDTIENLFEGYNGTLKSLKDTSNMMNDFYRQMMLEAISETKESLLSVGVTFEKNGTAKIDMKKMKEMDLETLNNLFGKESDLVYKVNFLSEKISDNAKANIKSLNSTYSANGKLYEAIGNNNFNFWG